MGFDVEEYSKKRKEEEEEKNKQESNSKRFDVAEYSKSRKASSVIEDLQNRIKSWSDSTNSLISSFNSRYYDEEGNYINQYRSDSSDWLTNVSQSRLDLLTEYTDLRSILENYKDYIEEDSYAEIEEMFKANSSTVSKIYESALSDNKYWSQFKTAEEEQKYRNEQYLLANRNLKKYEASINDLESFYSEVSKLAEERAGEGAYADVVVRNQLRKRGFESLEELRSHIDSLQDTYNKSYVVQMTNSVDPESEYYDPSTAQWIEKGNSIQNPTMDEASGTNIFGFRFGDEEVQNPVTYTRDNWSKYEAEIAKRAMSGGVPEDVYKINSLYMEMEENEVNAYSMLLAQDKVDGGNRAEKYLNALQEELEYRKAGTLSKPFTENPALGIVFNTGYNSARFVNDIGNLFSNTEGEKSDPSHVDYMSSIIASENADAWGDAPSWFGKDEEGNNKTWYNVANDVSGTIGYMLPSILASKLTFGASTALGLSQATAGTIGAVAGSGSMGLAAAGSGYQEMLDLGYSKEQARTYGMMIGIAEGLTSYALSGISAVGGKLTGNFIKKVADKVDNAIGRFAVNLGGKLGDLTENFVRPLAHGTATLAGSIGSEILEEELQLWLDPAIKSMVLDVDFEAPNADEMLYTALTTAFSTFLLEAGGTASTEINTVKKGKNIKSHGDAEVDRLAELGKTFSADTVAYQIASKVNKDTGAYTIGRLFNEMGASLSEANITDITNALVERGFTEEQAKVHAKWMNHVVEGGKLTNRQQLALESNPVLADVLYGTIIQPNSTVMQRNQAVNQLHGIESSMGIDRETLEEMNTPEAITQRLAYKRVMGEELRRGADPRSGLTSEHLSKIDDFVAKSKTTIPESNYKDVGQNVSYKPSSAKIADTSDKVSDTGATIVKSTGEETSIKKIASIDAKNKTMRLELSNGNTVDHTDVSYGNENQALLYESVLLMGYDANTANAIVQGFDPESTTSVKDYLIGTNESFNYGWGHIPEKGRTGSSYKALPESLRKYAVKLGEDARAADDNARGIKASQNQPQNVKKKSKGGYGAKLAVDGKSVTNRVKESVKALDAVAKALKLNIIVEDLGGKRYGYYRRSTNELVVDVNAGGNGKHTLLFTASHELVHYVRNWSPDKFTILADFLMEQYAANGENIAELIQEEIDKAYAASRGKHKMTYDEAYEEVVAQAMQRFLTDSNFIEHLASLQKKDASLAKRLVAKLKEILKNIRAAYQGMDTRDRASQAVKEMGDAIEELYAKMEEGLIAASEASQSIGSRNLEDFSEAKNTNGEDLFQYKAMEADEEAYRQMLKKHGIMSEQDINKLFSTIDKALVIIKNNLEVLDYAWEADIDDRSFSPVKPNSDNLYKVSLDFSTLCRKRILQQVIQTQLQDALKKPLSREESIAIRDELMKIQEEGRQIEIACALCYVESARMKSPAQIKKFLKNREAVIKEFLASKAGGDIKKKIAQAEADARERLGVGNATLKSMPDKIAEQIRLAKREAKKSYAPTAEEQKLIDTALSMSVTDFTSPEGLSNLAKNYPVLFDAYTSFVGNATKSKGIEKDTWWRAGDSDSIGDTLIANMNKENGLRSQSWSDFQVIHLLDYIAATIELSTRNAKEQAYSKVPDYIDLMGNTGVMLNMSLIPTAQFNGKLEYDSVEGMAYKKALELRDKYHATAGTICIGISNEQIKMLLDDSTIDYVIPYHKSGMAAHIRKLMHIPTWSEYEKYQNESNLSRDEALKQAKKYGVTLLSESDENYQKHTIFSEWFNIEEARQIAKQENAFPTDAKLQKKYGVMYGSYMAMKNAANNYLKLCAERGLSPKFSHENANFTEEANYWKLIIDRKMVDNVTGEIIEQQAIKPVFDETEVLRILNDELKRYPDVKADQDYATRTVVEKFLSGKMNDRLDADTVAAIMQKPVDNITTTNILSSSEQNTRLTDADLDEYMKVGKTQHTRNKKRRMLESGKKPILTSSEEILSFMADVIQGKASGEVRAFAKAGGRLASAVQQVDGKLEVFGDYLELNADDLRESYKVHSSPKEKGDIPLSDADFQRIPEYLDDFDGVLLTNYYNGKKEVHLYKETEDGYIRILAVSSSERGSLLVTKLIGVSKEKFEEKYAKKIERNTGSPRGQTGKSDASIPLTEARLTAGVLSDVIVSQKPNSVNTNQKISTTLNNAKDEMGEVDEPTATAEYADIVNTEDLKSQYIDTDETYSYIGKEVLGYNEGNRKPDLTLVEVVNERTGLTETTIKFYGEKPKNYVPKKIAYCYKLFEQHPDGTLHALFAGASNATPIGEWVYSQGFPYTDSGVKGMNLRERYGWHLSAGLPSAPHLMSPKAFERGYPSKKAYGHPKDSKRVWVRMAYDATTDFNSIADSTRKGDIFGLIPFGGYYAFKENNQSEWVISSAVKIDKILTEDERQQILKEAGFDEYEAWRKKHRATDAEKAEAKRKSAENKKAKDKAMKEGLNYLSESSKAMREAIKSRIIDNPELDDAKNQYIDSEGNQLSEGQKEFFKDSKIRDKNGNLLVVRHGTNTDFNIFDFSKSGKNGKAEGYGFYFSDDPEITSRYGGIQKEVYLNITKPLYNNKRTIKKADAIKLTNALIDFDIEKYKSDGLTWQDSFISNYVMTYDMPRQSAVREFVNQIWEFNTNDQDLVFEIAQADGRMYESSTMKEFYNVLTESIGYDGIIAEWSHDDGTSNVYVTFNSEQSKYITNTTPTSDPDLRYQYEDVDAIDNRTILAKSLEGAAKTDVEKQKLKEYQSKIDLINSEEKKLRELRSKIKEISFSKGTRDTEKLKKLQFEANQAANRINVYDKQLLRLEATQPRMDVLQREKELVRKKMDQKRKEAVRAAKEKDMETMRELMNRHTESRKKAIERRDMAQVRNKIKALKTKLEGSLLRPTDRSYIPFGLVQAVIDVCDIINTDTDLYKDDGTINKAQERRNQTKEKLQALKDEYEKLKDYEDPVYSGEFDDAIYAMLKDLRERYDGRSLKEMNLGELSDMYDILRSIGDTLADARKLIGKGEAYDVYEAGEAIIREQDEVAQKRKKEKRSGTQKAKDSVINLSLSPVRNVERMSGYKEGSALVDLFNDFEVGVRQKNFFEMESKKSFEAITTGENAKTYESAVYDAFGNEEYVDDNGRKFGVSKMQMMQAILSQDRERANKMHHIKGGGLVFADLKMLQDGKLKEAISSENSHMVANAENLIEQFRQDLANDKWAQEYMEVARSFFDGKAKDAINTTMLELKHRIVAKDKNYIPFEVDKNFVVREISAANDIQQTINAYGMLQETKDNAPQPLIMTGLNNIIDRHIDQVSTVVGLAIPVRNFNKVWNVHSAEGVNTTVNNAIEKNWGEEGKNFIKQVVQDIQGPRHNSQSKLYKAIKSGYIGATFLLNGSVVTKQIGSLFSATSMLKWRDPVNMIGNLLYTMANYKKIAAEVDKYTASAWTRRQGMSDSEVYTLLTEGKRSPITKALNKLPAVFNPAKWITAMDSSVALSLWKYAKEDIQKQHPELSGEELNRATASFYDSVIENTQSMTDVLHRPEIQKRSDILSEAFGMFKTDLYQMSGQLQNTAGKFGENKSKENAKALGRTVYSIAASALWGQLMTSVFALLRYKVNPYRDDEDDELTVESWFKRSVFALSGDITGYVFPLFGSEVVGTIENIVYGESEDIADSLALTAINDLYSTAVTIASSLKEGEAPSIDDFKKLLTKSLQVFGIPASNVLRTIEAVSLHAKDIANGELFSFEAGREKTKGQSLYEAILRGNEEQIEKIESQFKDQDAINTAIRKALRENDPRIKEAAKELIAGNIQGFGKYIEDIASEGHFDKEMVEGAIRSEKSYFDKKIREAYEAKTGGDEEEYKKIVRELRDSYKGIYTQDDIVNFIKNYVHDEDETSDDKEEATSIYTASDINAALENGDTSAALEVIADLVKVKTENYIADGKSKKEAEKSAKSSIRSSLTSYWKPLYLAAYNAKNNAEMARIRKLLNSTKVYDNVVETCQDWVKQSKKSK